MKVTFSLPADGNGGRVSVVVDFNGWDATATPLRKRGDRCSASVTVPASRRYAFRYLGDADGWFNDGSADSYEPNGFGEDNCIIDLNGPAT